MTRDDLEDILGFDGVAALFGSLGLFLLSGPVWVIAEKMFDPNGFQFDALVAFCAACVLFGIVSLGAGLYFHSMKRGRIKRIFDQTKLISQKTTE